MNVLHLQPQLLDAVGDAAVTTDPDGRITYTNPAAEQLFAWGREEVVGRLVSEVVVTEDRRTLPTPDVLAQLRAGDTWEGEVWVRRRDGLPFPAHLSWTPLVDDNGNLLGALAISRDVTDERRSAARHAASERWFRTLVHNARDLIAVLDADARLRYANPAAERILGLPPAEQTGRSMLDLVHPDDRAQAAETLAEVPRQATWEHSQVLRVVTADGGWRMLELVVTNCLDDPAIAGLVISGRDVTDAHAAQAALARSETLLREAQRISHVGHWQWEVKSDRLDWLEQEVYDIHGLTPEEWQGTSEAWVALVHPDDRSRGREGIEEVLTTGTSIVEVRIVRPDGAVRHTRNFCEAVYDESGQLHRVVGVCQDVTEQENLRQDLQDRVRELTCLEEVGRAANESSDGGQMARVTVGALVSAMQSPQQAVAAVRLDGHEHVAGTLPVHEASIVAPVFVAGQQRGEVRVGYAEGGPTVHPDERRVVTAVAATLALWMARQDSSSALQESEARFRRFFDNAADIIYRYRLDGSADDLAFDYVSPSVEAITGYTPQELAQPGVVERVIHPDDRALFMRPPPHSLPEGDKMVRVLARDGSVRWTEHRIVPVHNRAGQLIAVEGVARDVTERMEAAHALQQRTREQVAIAQLGDAALRADDITTLHDTAALIIARTLPVDAVAVYESLPDTDELSVCAGVGWSDGVVGHMRVKCGPHSLAGMALARNTPIVTADLSASEIVHAAFLDREGVVGAATAAIGHGDAPLGAVGAYTREPHAWTTDEVSFLQTAAHVLGEAMERDRADEAIARREREFRTLAEHSPDIIVRFDHAHRNLYINPAVEDLLSTPVRCLLGKTFRELGAATELAEQLDGAIDEVFTTGEPTEISFSLSRPLGFVHLASRLIPEHDTDGAVATVLSVTRDITQLRRAEEQRRAALARVVVAQEEERGRIAEDIHDDSIQVMVAVSMRLEALKSQVRDPDAVSALARLEETVRRSVHRLRMLMFALWPPQLDREGLSAALQAYLEATSQYGRDWELVDDCAVQLPSELRIVLYRIAQEAVTNARKHADATTLQVTLADADGGVRLTVSDNGLGFRFEQAAVAAGPHHIGLATMRERAESAGGRLGVASTPGEGTVVTAWVPVPQSDADGQ